MYKPKLIIPIFVLISAILPMTAQNVNDNYIQHIQHTSAMNSVVAVEYFDGLGRPVETATNGGGQASEYLHTGRDYGIATQVERELLAVSSPAVDRMGLSVMAARLSSAYNGDNHAFTAFEYDGLGRKTKEEGPGQVWQEGAGHFKSTTYTTNKKDEVFRFIPQTCSYYGFWPAGSLNVIQETDEDGHTIKVYKDFSGNVVMERRGADNDTYYLYTCCGQLIYVLPPAISSSLKSAGKISGLVDSKLISSYGYRYSYYTGDGSFEGWSSNILLGECVLTQVNYYDNYNFMSHIPYSDRIKQTVHSDYAGTHADAAGLLTGKMVRILETPADSFTISKANGSKMLTTVMYYDSMGNAIQMLSENHLGSIDITMANYDPYSQKSNRKYQTHPDGSGRCISEEYFYTYDHTGRNTLTRYSLNGASPSILVSRAYDRWGRLSQKNETKYEYNIRGWVTKSSCSAFTEILTYAETVDGVTPQQLCYNGNISATKWYSAAYSTQGYQYCYDNLNRLTEANSFGMKKINPQETVISLLNHYSVSYAYDCMGNIVNLHRRGMSSNYQNQYIGYGDIDDLAMEYDGNRLVHVSDAVNSNPSYNGAFNFRQSSTADTQYAYDLDGRITKDMNKQIAISYNILGYPSIIRHTDTGSMEKYLYDAEGKKLRVSYITDGRDNKS